MIKEKLVHYLEKSIQQNWEKLAISDYQGDDFFYKEVGEQILRLHLLFEQSDISRGDKIALIGKNSANWAIVFIAIVSYGATAVPILPDFKPHDIHEIINHSDSKLLFVSDSIYELIDINQMKALLAIFSVNSFGMLKSSKEGLKNSVIKLDDLFKSKYKEKLTADNFKLPDINNDALAEISYTSGTTGHSKGVMLLHNSLAANVRYAQNNMPLQSGDKIVSFLPLAHSYGLAFEFLFPFSLGCHITFLTKTPSPQIITQAFSEIKPRLILSVPLVIEKIYKKRLLPAISKPSFRVLSKVPGVKSIIFKKVNVMLTAVFGGNFHEVIIGGAAFNAEAEAFFRKIKFPYTVGYGMTECGPLISYESSGSNQYQSSGKSVDTLEVKIDSNNPEKEAGEILIRGENVMEGYYKNEEATMQAIDKDGWLHSGDLGIIDKDGNIYIKGRSKSMILGASGQNIYPEEIESLINNKFGVLESLVIEEEGRLIALVCPDQETIEKNHIDQNKLRDLLEDHRKHLNHHIPAYMNVSKFIIHEEEFEKTPKRSIKRYLYSGAKNMS